MKNRVTIAIAMLPIFSIFFACKQRVYNQSKTKDLSAPADDSVTQCSIVSSQIEDSSGSASASLRVACVGQCNGVDYRNRKFYILNNETFAGLEFSATLNTGNEVRNLFIYEASESLISSIKNISLESAQIQKALQQYGLDPASVTKLSFPADAKILLLPGTKASLSTAGLSDGGTLDCGGQPVEGSIPLEQFKSQNLNDVRNALTTK